jgi:hypothetical protein
MVVSLMAGCGGDDGSATSTTAEASTTTTFRVPSATELEALVVAPPAPLEQQPDDVIDTGLMEPDNPDSGTIAIGYAQEKDLVDAGFVRGWEKYFHATDDSAFVTHVFVFNSKEGPQAMLRRFRAVRDPAFKAFDVKDIPDAAGFVGTSPKGLTGYLGAAARGRFLIGFTLGGPPGAHDYAGIFDSVMHEQLAALPDP